MSDYLDPSEWLHLAQQLERGSRAMHQHTCGAGQKLLVENADAGFKAWCYRCSQSGFVPHPQPSFKERIAALRAVRLEDEATEADPRPPMPAEFDPSKWPDYARVWLYKVGITNPVIQQHGIYWCARIKRVVLPVLDGSKLIYWQARGFDPERPKYLNPKVDKPFYKAGENHSGPLVLTEDILSAVRVGQVAQAWSILGTSLSPLKSAEIAKLGIPVAIWLDPDAAGRKGRGKIYRELSALGVDARVIRSDKDPKEYSRDEIKEFLSLA